MRILPATAAISLAALITFGASLTYALPHTPADALEHSSAFDTSSVYVWKCPSADGYTTDVFTMEIPERDYEDSMHRSELRQPTVFCHAPAYLIESDNPYVKKVAEHILECTEDASDYVKVTAALWFVQSAILYTSDQDLYGCNEFWATPTETLYLHRGDCEDTAVLLCSVLGAMGLRSVLLDYPGHEAVGVYLGDSGDCIYCESAGDVTVLPGVRDSRFDSLIPEVYSEGSGGASHAFSSFVAGYRDLIERVTGT